MYDSLDAIKQLAIGIPFFLCIQKKNQKDIITLPTCVACNVVENISHGILYHTLQRWVGKVVVGERLVWAFPPSPRAITPGVMAGMFSDG